MNTETLDGVHYQSVVCSAVAGRPQAQISWLVKDVPVSGDPFTVDVSDVHHSNGTSTVSSVLRFPTYLQDEDAVTCLVQHPTLQEDKVTTVTVETYSKIALCANVHQRCRQNGNAQLYGTDKCLRLKPKCCDYIFML